MPQNPFEKLKFLFHLNSKEEKKSPDLQEQIDEMYNSLESDLIAFYVGEDFTQHDIAILELIQDTREKYKDKLGFIIPAIRFKTLESLQENQYIVKIRDTQIEEKYVIPSEKEILKDISESLDFIIENYIDKIFTYDTLENYIDLVQKENSWLIWNLTNILSIQDIKNILLNILQEHKSIKEISYIFELIYEQSIEYNKQNKYNTDINIEVLSKNIINSL